MSTLSVETSRSGSSTATSSPSDLSQRVTVPSVTDSPSAGMVTVWPSPPSDARRRRAACGCSACCGLGLARRGLRLLLGAGGLGGRGRPPASGAGSGSGADSAAGALATGAGRSPSPMTARSAPTGTVSSSWARISCRVPATGEGISVSTLSVETSSSGSSTSTRSPTFFSQRVTVPSVTDSPRAGMVTRSDMTCSLLFPVSGSSVCVQGLTRQGQVCLAERLVLCGVRVDETGDVLRVRLPVHDELCLADLLAHPGADHVDADDGSVDLARRA